MQKKKKIHWEKLNRQGRFYSQDIVKGERDWT